MPILGTQTQTPRGFLIVEFVDRYGVPCSLQASSLAEYAPPGTSAVWLGPDYADPKILACDAQRLGIETTETCGWVPYPIPDDVLLTTRMHLDRDQVAALIGHLQAWLDTGQFSTSPARAAAERREPAAGDAAQETAGRP